MFLAYTLQKVITSLEDVMKKNYTVSYNVPATDKFGRVYQLPKTMHLFTDDIVGDLIVLGLHGKATYKLV